jgi:transposase
MSTLKPILTKRPNARKVKRCSTSEPEQHVEPETGSPARASFALTASDEVNHWRKRYFKKEKECQDLQGLLSLREERIKQLEEGDERKDARIKELEKIIWGRSSEKNANNDRSNERQDTSNSSEEKQDDADETPLQPPTESSPVESNAKKDSNKKPRGGQTGSPRPGRDSHDALPTGEEPVHPVDPCCEFCGEEMPELAEEVSQEVEVEVRAYKRVHRRKKRGHFCTIKGKFVSKTAPIPGKLFPKGGYGINLWSLTLIWKFFLHIPLNRLLVMLSATGLDISAGTVIAGWQRIKELLKPLFEEIRRYSREKNHWHLDDTGWKVFVTVEGKAKHNRYLWVFRSNDVCYYVVSKSRARAVPQKHLEKSVGVVSSDRLGSNMKLGPQIIPQFCWVHIRREFLKLSNAYPALVSGCQLYLDLIAAMYHANKQRLLSEPDSPEYVEAEERLTNILSRFKESAVSDLDRTDLHKELRRVLKGIVKDWDGLTAFLELSSIPLDNNMAENALRGPVVGRKCYYGQHAEWTAKLAADMFGLCETLRLNNINPFEFFPKYFQACTENGSVPPSNAKAFLPWLNKPAPE